MSSSQPVLQAPGPNINFGTAPSGSSYISDANGLIVITNGSVSDQTYLLQAGCVNLVPGGIGGSNLQTGTDYTVQQSDLGCEIICTNAGAFTLHLPNAMPVGFYVIATQGGAGDVTASPKSGATRVGAHADTGAQYAPQLKCVVIQNTDGQSAVWNTIQVGS